MTDRTPPNNYHCMMCNYVKYGKENICLPKQEFINLELGVFTSGIYHHSCMKHYINNYLGESVPDAFREEMHDNLTIRINELIQEMKEYQEKKRE